MSHSAEKHKKENVLIVRGYITEKNIVINSLSELPFLKRTTAKFDIFFLKLLLLLLLLRVVFVNSQKKTTVWFLIIIMLVTKSSSITPRFHSLSLFVYNMPKIVFRQT